MRNKIALFGILCLASACQAQEAEQHDTAHVVTVANEPETKDYELVFALDATGSMAGLISTAKEKIWDIVSGVSQSQEVKSLKLGMVFYRDRGDAFVTKVYPLTGNIDSIYSELLAIQAAGGGDAPESVNLGLNNAIESMKWSTDINTYKTVFLVGDCPPHMDYNEIQYPGICASANKKHIIINTIKLGNQCTDAILHFKEIARLTQGSFQQLDQHAKDVVIATPFDDSINLYSRNIDESKIYYGTFTQKEVMYSKKDKSISFYSDASATSNAARAKYNTTKAGKENWFGKNELIQSLLDSTVAMDSIQVAELPDELRELDKEEQAKVVEQMKQKRIQEMKKLDDFVKEKDKFIRAEKAKTTGKESFSDEVIKTMKEQASKK